MVAHTFTCPQGLYFNSLTDGCDFRRNVDCGGKDEKDDPKKKTTTPAPRDDDDEKDEESQDLADILSEIKEAGKFCTKSDQKHLKLCKYKIS